MGIDEVEHGNTERTHDERRASEWRDMRYALLKLYTLGPKPFNRRFKINRVKFDDIVEKIKPLVEVNDHGKKMAERSSALFVPTTLQLAATLRFLACAYHACREDNYNLATTTFYRSVGNAFTPSTSLFRIVTSTRKTRASCAHTPMACTSVAGDSSRDVSALLMGWQCTSTSRLGRTQHHLSPSKT